jgi:hypothetical protein
LGAIQNDLIMNQSALASEGHKFSHLAIQIGFGYFRRKQI